MSKNSLSKPEIDENFLNLRNGVYKDLHHSSYLMEKDGTLSLVILASEITQEKETEGIHI